MIVHPIAVVIGLAVGFLLSQAPEFMQQYRQRLGGTVDELQRIVQQFDEDSSRSGYDRSAALGVMANNAERLVRDQAGRMEENIGRLSRLREQQEAFRDGGTFVRMASFVRNFDRPLAQRTYDAYEPAVPVTMEGLALGLGGFFASYFLVSGMAKPWRHRRRLRV